MVTEIDEKKGLVKVYWQNIRNRFSAVEPTFAKLVDALNPDKTLPLYLAYYPYGALIGDTQSPFIPSLQGENYRLCDPDAPKDVIRHLGYGKDNCPFGMLLEKQLEYFIDLKSANISMPSAIYSPGAFFPFAKILSQKKSRVYAPNGLLSTTSGARSTFMLPNIGCATNHSNLKKDFNLQLPPPKNLCDHWYIFKEIINSNVINCDWRSCIIYFSEKWIEKINNDKEWLPIRMYLHELAWHHFEFDRNRAYYDIVFSLIQKQRNLKPNPYLVDTASHLFRTAIGAAPGYIPACNDEALPVEILRKAFLESYGLKKYYATIMQPSHFNFEKDKFPIYYSLKNPSTDVFSPKSRTVSSTIFEMRELEYIMKIFISEFVKENSICSDTIFNKVVKNVEFNYFHNEIDQHKIILSSNEIIKKDNRFKDTHKNIPLGAKFSSDAPFMRGCISIKTRG